MINETPYQPARVTMQVRWSDVDLFGHVNNAAFLRYLDDARFATFPRIGVDELGALTEALLVVVKHEIDYRAPLTFTQAPVVVEVWVPRVGRSSVDFCYRITSGKTEHLLARSRMVQLDRESHRPRPFTDDERVSFEGHPGPEVVLHGW
ncbi:MAG: acyl-CoA thioesterase [Promicromonosporaceae bacterium]|nr:acyl-CoA thioesterase [Promicromonosporaceae bacterium]